MSGTRVTINNEGSVRRVEFSPPSLDNKPDVLHFAMSALCQLIEQPPGVRDDDDGVIVMMWSEPAETNRGMSTDQ